MMVMVRISTYKRSSILVVVGDDCDDGDAGDDGDGEDIDQQKIFHPCSQGWRIVLGAW